MSRDELCNQQRELFEEDVFFGFRSRKREVPGCSGKEEPPKAFLTQNSTLEASRIMVSCALCSAVLMAIAASSARADRSQGLSIDSGATLAASYRKDVYLPDYKEDISYNVPKDGGRVHVVATNVTCSGLSSVKINGQQALNLSDSDKPDFTYFDWARAHTDPASRTIWISFHSRNNDWLPDSASASLSIEAKDSSGQVCVSGNVTVQAGHTTTVAYATTVANGSEVVVYVRNGGTDPAKVNFIEVNGVRVEGAITLGSGQTHVGAYTQTSQLAPGQLWAAVIQVDGVGAPQGWGGRVLKERFPIEAWTHGDDCSYPGINDGNAKQLLDAAIDSALYDQDSCGDMAKAASALGASSSKFHAFVKLKTAKIMTNIENVDAIFLGDEVDGNMDSNLRTTDPSEANALFPGVPTYQGGKTNAHVGAYAGITDIQGMDAYAAACAPTIIPVVHSFPLQYPYLYLRNARNNHAPLPTWLYSQLYSDAWSYQANENEIVTQIGQAVAAGAKGITLFQSFTKQFKEHDFGPISSALHSVAAVREDLRAGVVEGLVLETSAKLGDDALVEVVRSPSRVVVIVVSLKAHGYSNTLCHIETYRHWTFDDLKIDSIKLKDTPVRLGNFTEIVKGAPVAPKDAKAEINDAEVEIKDVTVDAKMPLRIFTLDVLKTSS